jgi:hypothetical protein
MRHILATLTVLLSAGVFAPAQAQGRAWPERFWFSLGGGYQPAANGFDDAFDRPLYAETERVTVDYPAGGGALVSASGGYRIWKHVTVGLGVTRNSRRSDALVAARVPHPFFDNQFRDVEGPARTRRAETGAHLLFGWMMPVTDRIRIVLSAGPSFLDVEQTLVTDVELSEVYPYDTAAYTGAATRRATGSATGFNAGADVFWMLSRRLGAGGLVQVTRATVRQDAGNGRRISVDAGGAQASAGIRLVF